MARARFLPKYVTRFVDRHSKERLRFRRAGYPSHYFKSPLGTEDFRIEYQECMSKIIARVIERTAATPGSVDDLLARYYAVPERLGPSARTQTKVRAVLERFREGRGERLVRNIKFDHIERIVAKRREQSTAPNGRPVGGPEAAHKLRKELLRLFDFAIKLGWLTTNPARISASVKRTPAERSSGYHTWTAVEIAQYRAHHSIGTMARLAMELMLWTGQRRGDAIQMTRIDAADGWLEVTQRKGAKTVALPIVDDLRLAIEAVPATCATILSTTHGKPFTDAGFGNWFRERCDEAGLKQCTSHGLRKAMMTMLAEDGATQQELKAVSGHSGDDEVATYTRSANQRALAAGAINRLARNLASNRLPGLDKKIDDRRGNA